MKFSIWLTPAFWSLLVCLMPFAAFPQTGEWKTVSNAREEIDFEIPETNFREFPAKDPDKFDVNRYYSLQSGYGFDVNTSNSLKSSIFGGYLAFASPFAKQCTEGDLSGFKTYECTFSESGYFHSFKFVITKHRIYSFYAYGPGQFSPKAQRFFESVLVAREFNTTPTIVDAEIEANWGDFLDAGKLVLNSDLDLTPDSAKPKQEVAVPGNRAESNAGVGSGIGSGSKKIESPAGSGIGTGSKRETAEKMENTPLRIYSKPRPGYTNLARYFLITGTVRLRVRFSADGSIGLVEPISTLPFGLTEKAIRAARGLTFKPERRGGKTINVIKIVAYNFTIY